MEQSTVMTANRKSGPLTRGMLWLLPAALLALGLLLGASLSTAGTAVTTQQDEPAGARFPNGEMPTFEPLKPLDVHPRTSLTIVEQLRRNHFVSKSLDDSVSSEIFDKYLETLDENRLYFTQSDVDTLETYRYRLDDALKRGDLEPAFNIYNRYQQRRMERLEHMIGLIDAGLDQLALDSDAQLKLDRSEAPWADSAEELDKLWRERLKASIIGMRLNDRDLEEIQDLLQRRYSNRLRQAAQANSEDAFQTYVNAFASTYDPHTQYLSPRSSENFNMSMSLSLEGIGAVLRSSDEYTEVVRLVPAGPADKAGQLQPADRIISVGQGESGRLIDVVGWRLDDVVELIRGPKNSTVRLEILPSGSDSESRVISITREAVQLEEQSAQSQLLELEHEGTTRKVGVIQIPTFYADFAAMQQGDPNFKSTTRDVRKLIEEMKAEGMEALVVDLRNNGGGSLQEADSLVGLFIESGPTVQVKTANRRPNVYADTNGDVAWDGPLSVMVNRLSASASEIFAGAIQDYGRGIVVGSQTFGKGTVQSLVPLNRGQLKLTQAKFYRVSGQSTQHQGVIPDIEFPEVFDVERIGESAYPDALPWDVIQPVVYQRSEQFKPFLDDLRDRHTSRASDDPEFRYYQALAERMREDRKRTHVSLNESERRAEKVADDAWRLKLENDRRKARGEEPLASMDELNDERVEEEAQPARNAEALKEDAMIRESAMILLDFLKLRQQVADNATDGAVESDASVAQIDLNG